MQHEALIDRSRAILQAINDIERVLDENPIAEPNKVAVTTLQEIANRLSRQHKPAGDHARQIHRLGTLFYGERRHQQRGGGAAALYAAMRVALLDQILLAAKDLSAREEA